MIYGEETLKIPMNRGLWYNRANDSIPEGYCSEFVNLLVDDIGNVIPRGAFRPVILTGDGVTPGVTGAYTFLSAFITENRFRPVGGYGTNTTAFLDTWNKYAVNYRGSIAQKAFNNVNLDTGYAGPLVQYRDRFYFVTAGGIRRFSGLSFVAPATTAAAYTEAVVEATITSLSGLIFHKTRLFGWIDNRVKFTDEVTVGGYPETWNVAANFFDLPSDGAPTIHAMFNINGMLYIFSEDGVYTASIYGSPVNWTVKAYDKSLLINDPRKICQSRNGIVYYSDGSTVYAYNGERSIEVGQPIKDALRYPESSGGIAHKIFPFENGIIVNVLHYTSGGDLMFGKLYYFDGNLWTEITIGTNDIIEVGYAFTNPTISGNTLVPDNKSTSTSFLNVFLGSFVGGGTSVVLYYVDDKYQDYISDNTYDNIVCAMTVPAHASVVHEKRFKYGYLDLYSDPITLTKDDVSQDITGTPDTLPLLPLSLDKNYLVKFKLPQLVRRLALRFTMDLQGFDSGYSPFKLKGLYALMNTHRTEPDELSG